MESTAPRVTRARLTGRKLPGWVIWRFFTVAVVVGATVIVWGLPHAHRAVEPRAELPVSGGHTPSANSIAERITAIGEAVQRGDLATASGCQAGREVLSAATLDDHV